jgi:hypothetical protein
MTIIRVSPVEFPQKIESLKNPETTLFIAA